MLASLRTALRERRRLALVVAVALGALAATPAVLLTTVAADVVALLALGVAGTAYYGLHYRSPYPEDRSFARSFLRIFVVAQLGLAFAPADDFARSAVTIAAIVSLVSLVVLATVIDARDVSAG